MNIKYIDNHSHLNLLEFEKDYREVFERARNAGVGVINVGTDLETSKRAVDIAKELGSFAIVGHHPNESNEFDYEAFLELAKDQKVVAIGECGLDYFRSAEETKEKQKEVFESQIKIALAVDKPLMLHIRDNGTGQAYRDVLSILNTYYLIHNTRLRGNVHFFAGTIDIADQFLELGFTLSFTGAITYGHNYDEVIKHIPLDRMLSETDCPFVAPVPYRGKRNEPAYVVEVVKKIAEIKGIPVDDVAEQLLQNSKKLFNI